MVWGNLKSERQDLVFLSGVSKTGMYVICSMQCIQHSEGMGAQLIFTYTANLCTFPDQLFDVL